MDGVIADFFTAALAVWSVKLEDLSMPKPWIYDVGMWIKTVKDLPPSIPSDNFHKDSWFSKGIAETKEFWKTIPIYPWAFELVDTIQWNTLVNEVHICTMPMLHDGCIQGKLDWLSKNFPTLDRPIVTDQKHLLACPNRILIDDRQDSCEKFRAHGGRAIEFPQPWNNKHWVVNKLPYVRGQLTQELESMI